MSDPRRILVIRRRAIGDVLVSVDVARALKERWPQAHLVFVVDQAAALVVEGSPFIDEVFVYERRHFQSGPLLSRLRNTIEWLRRLRRVRADLVVDLMGIPQTALWTRWTGAALRVGPRRRQRTWAYNRLVEPETGHRFAGERFLDWVRALGIDPGPWRAHAPAAATQVEWEGRADTRPLVILNPSATWTAKAWPLKSFAALGQDLGEDFDVRVAWGPGDEATRDAVVDGGAGRIQPLPPTTLGELGAWLGRAALLITIDSGPKHLAVAMGTRTLTLYGSTNPAGWQAPGDDHFGVTHPVDCHPCDLTECPVPGHPCLDDLEPARVAATARDILAGGQAHG